VPCYNEENNIPLLIENFRRLLAERPNAELLLVDNGSQDKTGEAITKELDKIPFVNARKVTVPENKGYGYGILYALKEAKGAALSWTHADLQTDPGDILRAFDLYQRETTAGGRIIVKGFRRGRNFSDKILSFGMQILSSLALGMWLSEINAQPKLFPRKLFSTWQNAPLDFSLDLYMLWSARRSGYSIRTIPVYFKQRVYGEAKGGGGGLANRWKLLTRTIRYIFNLRRRVLAD